MVHTPPQHKSAYRRWFSRLDPALQLVLMQLWMPVFMCLMFMLCYVGAFHHIAPHHVPVGVIGTAAQAETYQTRADKAEPGGFDFELVHSLRSAEQRVRSGDLGIAYVADDNTIIVARAHQAQAASLLPVLVTPFLGAATPPTEMDVAPLPPGDLGMTPMYLMLCWCISGYLCAMFIGLMGGPLRRRSRFRIIGVVGVCLSFLSSFLVSFVLGAIKGHFFQLWGLGFCWAVAIGVAVNGLSYYVGRFIAVPSMTIFIFLSVPSSGAAMPKWLVPPLFGWLNHVVAGSGITEMLKRMIYNVGPGYHRGWIMLSCYLVIGLVLTWFGRPYWEWLRVRQLLNGKTTMFRDAQRANGRKNDKENQRILAAFGLAQRDDGALIRIPPESVQKQLRDERRRRERTAGARRGATGAAEPVQPSTDQAIPDDIYRESTGESEGDRWEGRWDQSGIMDTRGARLRPRSPVRPARWVRLRGDRWSAPRRRTPVAARLIAGNGR